MQDKIKVSILVPIYNVESFLEQCLSSLVGQTLEDIEIICINDGSKDNSLSIIHRFIEENRRITLINKANSGYGDSMNCGIDAAKGEYIGIVESDDFADVHMFEKLYELAIKYDADIAKSCFYHYWGNKNKSTYCNSLNIEGIVFDKDLARDRMFYSEPSIWSGIFRKDFLNDYGIRFMPTPGASYQDTSFAFKTTAMARRIVLSDNAYLNYRLDNANSSVKIADKEKIMYVNREYDEVRRYILENRVDEENPLITSTYCTCRFMGYMWNYERIDNELRKEYWDICIEEINNHGEGWIVDFNKLQDLYTKHGGYNLLMKKETEQFNTLLRRYVIKKELARRVRETFGKRLGSVKR